MNDEGLSLDASRCALIIQDMQNDVMMDGGAFAETGAPEHAKEQNVVANIAALAETCRSKGIPVSTCPPVTTISSRTFAANGATTTVSIFMLSSTSTGSLGIVFFSAPSDPATRTSACGWPSYWRSKL